MKAGRELDALVAEKVMGWTRDFPECPQAHPPGAKKPNYHRGESCSVVIPYYSTKIEAAWLVAEKCHMEIALFSTGMHRASCPDPHSFGQPFTVYAETAPLVICLAALRACGVEVPTGESNEYKMKG